MQNLLALSVRQPWAHAIVHLGKDIENRSRGFGHTGWTLVHASAGLRPDENSEAADWMSERGLVSKPLPGFLQLDRGGIVGIVKVEGCLAFSASPWWTGPRGLKLSEAHPLPFIPCKGTVAPLFWRPDDDALDRVRVGLLALKVPELTALARG